MRETLEICESGVYMSAGGVDIDITKEILLAKECSRIYAHNESVSWRGQTKRARADVAKPSTRYEVLNVTTMTAARLLADELREAEGLTKAIAKADANDDEAFDGGGGGGGGNASAREGEKREGEEDDAEEDEFEFESESECESEAEAEGGLMGRGGASVAVLNFASGRRPGGGFVKGGVAQEEDNCLCSALYPCLSQDAMQPHYEANSHGAKGDAADADGAKVYTDSTIYSPDVPVIRDGDSHELLDRPFATSIISAPAVNCRTQRQQAPATSRNRKAKGGGRRKSGRAAANDDAGDDAAAAEATDANLTVRAVMVRRMRRVLAIAATNGHTHLVLGAWGCGVFQGDETWTACTWMDLLTHEFDGVFERVLFAVLSDEQVGDEETAYSKFRSNVAQWEAGSGKQYGVNRQPAGKQARGGGPNKGGRKAKGRGGGGAWRKKGRAGKESGHEQTTAALFDRF